MQSRADERRTQSPAPRAPRQVRSRAEPSPPLPSLDGATETADGGGGLIEEDDGADSLAKAVETLWESDDLARLTRALDRIEADLQRSENRPSPPPPPRYDCNNDGNSDAASTSDHAAANRSINSSASSSSSSSIDPSEIFLSIQAAFLRATASSHEGNLPVGMADRGDRRGDLVQRSDGGDHDSIDDAIRRRRYALRSLSVTESLARTVVGPAWHSLLQKRRNFRRQVKGGGRSDLPRRDEDLSKPSDTISVPRHHGGLPSGVEHKSDPTSVRPTVQPPENQTRSDYGVDGPPLSSLHGSSDLIDRHGGPNPSIPELLPAAMIRFAAFFTSDDRSHSKQGTLRRILQMQTSIVRSLAFPPSNSPTGRCLYASEECALPGGAPPLTSSAASVGSWQVVGVHAEMTSLVHAWLRWAAASTDHGLHEDLGLAGGVFSLYHALLRVGGWRPCPPMDEAGEARACDREEPRRQAWCLDAISAVVTVVDATRKAGSVTISDPAGNEPKRHNQLKHLRYRSLLCLHEMVSLRLVPDMAVPVLVDRMLSILPPDPEEAQVRAGESPDLVLETLFALLQHEATAVSTMDELLDALDTVAKSSLFVSPGNEDERSASAMTKACWSVFVLSAALWGSGDHDFSATTCLVHKSRLAIPMLRVFFDVSIQSILQGLKLCARWVSERSVIENHSHDADTALARLAEELLTSLCRTIRSQRSAEGDASAVPYLSVTEWERIISSLDSCVVMWLLRVDSRLNVVRQAASQLIKEIGLFLECSTDLDAVPFVEYEHQRTMYLFLLRRAIPMLDDDVARTAAARSVLRNWIKYGLFPFRLEGWSQTAGCVLEEAFRKRALDGSMGDPYVYEASVRLEALKGLTKDGLRDSSGSFDGEVLPSLLVFTQHMRELHLDLIRSAIIPCLRDAFRNAHSFERNAKDSEHERDQGTQVDQLALEIVAERLGATVSASAYQIESTQLALHCVQLAGRLYRSVSGDRELRVLFVNLLEGVALAENAYQQASVRVEAVLELSRCLEAAFVTLLHAHESVPRLIQSLCRVLDAVSAARQSNTSNGTSEASEVATTVLGVAALDPLTRLRVAIDGKVAFRAREEPATDTSALLLPFFAEAVSDYRSAVVETHGTACVSVDGTLCSSSAATKVSFDGIMASVATLLQTFSAASRRALSFPLRCMRIHCFDILRHQFLASIPVRLPVDVARSVFAAAHSTADEADDCEVVARCLALIRCAENAVILVTCRKAGDQSTRQSDIEFVPVVLGLVLQLLRSRVVPARVIACQGIAALIPSLYDVDTSCATRLVSQVISFLAPMIVAEGQPTASAKSFAMSTLTLVHDLACCPIELSDELMAHFLRLTCLPEADGSYQAHLARECAALTLDRMTIDGLDQLVHGAGCHRAGPAGDDVLIDLASEIFHQRREASAPGQEQIVTTDDSGTLECLSEEVTDVEAFQSLQGSAWLISDRALFTCRIGAPRTRCSGFIEVATRTLAGRQRKLIRIPNSVSVHNPEFPSLLILPPDDDEISPWPLRSHGETNITDMPAEAVAATVIERYNRVMFHPASQGESDDECSTVEESPTEGDAKSDSDEAHSRASGVSEWLAGSLSLDPKDLVSLSLEIKSYVSTTTPTLPPNLAPAECRLSPSAHLDRMIGVLDRTPCSSTYKFGLLYDQSARSSNPDMETSLLMTRACSPAFYRFAHMLGQVVPNGYQKFYSGGLDTSNMQSDGKFALVWAEASMDATRRSTVASRVIVFHSVDMMPWDGPAARVARKRHIGNDFVLILFADRGSDAIVEFDLKGGQLIGGAFGFVVIWVTVAQPGIYRINVRVRKQRMNDELNAALLPFVGDYAIAEDNAPRVVRNIAMRADLACRAATGAADAPSNYVYRHHLLREMKRFALANAA